MLDLKAKLASAGLITQEDIARAEKSKGQGRRKDGASSSKAGKAGRSTASQASGMEVPVAKLKGKPKGEIYETVRKWVEHYRLDRAGGIPTETAQPYHFVQMTGKVGRLTLEPEVLTQLQKGEAGVVAYMSNHGLAHAVVPVPTARSVAEIYPLWLRVLEGDPRAGAVEEKSATP